MRRVSMRLGTVLVILVSLLLLSSQLVWSIQWVFPASLAFGAGRACRDGVVTAVHQPGATEPRSNFKGSGNGEEKGRVHLAKGELPPGFLDQSFEEDKAGQVVPDNSADVSFHSTGWHTDPMTVTFRGTEISYYYGVDGELWGLPSIADEVGTPILVRFPADPGGTDRSAFLGRLVEDCYLDPPSVNRLLRLGGLNMSYDPADPRAAAGVFTIEATFRNTSDWTIEGLRFQVVALTGGNELLNATGIPHIGEPISSTTTLERALVFAVEPEKGKGAILAAPETLKLGPGQSYTQQFEIGLARPLPFLFFIKAYGMPVDADGKPIAKKDPVDGEGKNGFQFPVGEEQLGINRQELYLPILIK